MLKISLPVTHLDNKILSCCQMVVLFNENYLNIHANGYLTSENIDKNVRSWIAVLSCKSRK